MRQKNKPKRPAIVGIVDSITALDSARGLKPGMVDALEWRSDCLPRDLPMPKVPFPWILTVRHPSEGGQGSLTVAERRRRFFQSLPDASIVDVELRSVGPLADVAHAAREAKAEIILSFHDFKKTPSAARLLRLAQQARRAGADTFKVATWATSARDIIALLQLLRSSPLPVAAMAMGPLGPGSRLLLAACGSRWNYGWLDRPNVPGQLSALELRRLLPPQ